MYDEAFFFAVDNSYVKNAVSGNVKTIQYLITDTKKLVIDYLDKEKRRKLFLIN